MAWADPNDFQSHSAAVLQLLNSDSLQPHELQHFSSSLSPSVCSNSCPLSWRWHPTISSSVAHFSSCPSIFPSIRVFSNELAFPSGGQCIGASTLASVLPMNIEGWFPLDWLVWSCCLWDSQESYPAPQFKSINSLALSLLDGPALTSVRDYWKNQNFDYRNLCG